MEDKKKPNSEKQGLARYIQDAYNREECVRSHPGRTLEVLKHREAAKRRHESRVKANTHMSPIGKGSNDLSALTATAVRKVTVTKHLVRVCK